MLREVTPGAVEVRVSSTESGFVASKPCSISPPLPEFTVICGLARLVDCNESGEESVVSDEEGAMMD